MLQLPPGIRRLWAAFCRLRPRFLPFPLRWSRAINRLFEGADRFPVDLVLDVAAALADVHVVVFNASFSGEVVNAELHSENLNHGLKRFTRIK